MRMGATMVIDKVNKIPWEPFVNRQAGKRSVVGLSELVIFIGEDPKFFLSN